MFGNVRLAFVKFLLENFAFGRKIYMCVSIMIQMYMCVSMVGIQPILTGELGYVVRRLHVIQKDSLSCYTGAHNNTAMHELT